MKKITRLWQRHCVEIYGAGMVTFATLGFEWAALGAITLMTATMIRREWYAQG